MEARPDRVQKGCVAMAHVNLNPVLEQIRGKVGDLVFRRWGDEVIIGRRADPTGKPPTPGQAAHRQQFKLAALYGKAVVADPAAKSLYAAGKKRKGMPVFALAVADFFNEPVVESIDLSGYTGKAGETLKIQASDDFEVKGVAVRILDTTGAVVEEGPASNPVDDGQPEWLYQTKATLPEGQAVSIEVTATDRPGHKTTKVAAKS